MQSATCFTRLVCLLAAVLLATVSALPQGSKADYDRALTLGQRTENKVFRAQVKPIWLPGGTSFWYRVKTGPETEEFVIVDCVAGTRTVTNAAPEAVAPLKPLATDASPRRSRRTGDDTEITFVNRTGTDLELYWLDTEGQRQSYGRVRVGQERRQHTFAGHVWLLVDALGNPVAIFEATDQPNRAEITAETSPNGRPRPQRERPIRSERGLSPDGQWVAFVKGHNLHLRHKVSGEPTQLSTDGTDVDEYAEDVSWSPDSACLVARRVREGQGRQVTFVEAAPKGEIQPKVHSHRYLKAGDKLPKPLLRVVTVADQRLHPVADHFYANPFTEDGDIDIRWASDGREFYFHYNERGHQTYRVLGVNVSAAVDAAQGRGAGVPGSSLEPRVVLEETSATFIDYSNKTWHHWLDSTGELLWMSERDGWAHLWLYDVKTGQPKNQVTRGEWVVREVLYVDETRRQVWFMSGGVRSEQDPYQLHLCRADFNGSSLAVLTEGDGNHKVEFSPDRRWFLDTWSRVDQPPVIELRRSEDGQRVCELERADASKLLAAGWTLPERFVAKGRDGATDIHGILIKPLTFDPAMKYPVIEEIYAGPQGAFAPKDFGRLVRQHAIAELGFIVVQMDGMGTNHRGKKFHDVAWKNLGDSGLPDRIAWIKAAAESRPWMDLTRVGIYGGSAGGQSSTRAVLAHGDFYKVAVSDCGCHDNRVDKIWWNEQWMGWPLGPHYAEQANVTLANNLIGKLLLIVGEVDTNVDPASTMQVAAALVRANKDFDLLVMPSTNHGAAETPYGSRRRMDFFVRHLLGKEPRW